jgi:hypothetical protein
MGANDDFALRASQNFGATEEDRGVVVEFADPLDLATGPSQITIKVDHHPECCHKQPHVLEPAVACPTPKLLERSCQMRDRSKVEIPMLKIQYLSRTPFKAFKTSFRGIQF